MIRILNAEPSNYSPKATSILEQVGQVDTYPRIDRSWLLQHVSQYDVLIVRLGFQVDRQVIDAGNNLKAIISATTGLDHIDLAYAESKNIRILSLRGKVEFLKSIPTTAEHTWAILLGLIRHVPWAFQSVLNGEWDRDRYKGHDLYRKRLGIVGLGRIGEKIANYGHVFGMVVLAYDPNPLTRPDWVEFCSTIDELLAQVDILTLHVPLNEQTQHLIGAAQLAKLPQGAIVINTARGKIIDEASLVAALESRHLGGAAVDVVEYERDNLEESPLLKYALNHHNVLVTPHIGGATFEAMESTEIYMANELVKFVRGGI